jgi:hypothetical protein
MALRCFSVGPSADRCRRSAARGPSRPRGLGRALAVVVVVRDEAEEGHEGVTARVGQSGALALRVVLGERERHQRLLELAALGVDDLRQERREAGLVGQARLLQEHEAVLVQERQHRLDQPRQGDVLVA